MHACMHRSQSCAVTHSQIPSRTAMASVLCWRWSIVSHLLQGILQIQKPKWRCSFKDTSEKEKWRAPTDTTNRSLYMGGLSQPGISWERPLSDCPLKIFTWKHCQIHRSQSFAVTLSQTWSGAVMAFALCWRWSKAPYRFKNQSAAPHSRFTSEALLKNKNGVPPQTLQIVPNHSETRMWTHGGKENWRILYCDGALKTKAWDHRTPEWWE